MDLHVVNSEGLAYHFLDWLVADQLGGPWKIEVEYEAAPGDPLLILESGYLERRVNDPTFGESIVIQRTYADEDYDPDGPEWVTISINSIHKVTVPC